MVVPIKDLRFIGYIKEMLSKIKDLPYSVEDYLNYIVSKLAFPDSLLLINLNETKINAFLFAELIDNINKEVFVDVCYIDPKAKNVGKEFMSALEEWAKMNQASAITALVPLDKIKAYERKYKFKPENAYVKRRLNYARKD